VVFIFLLNWLQYFYQSFHVQTAGEFHHFFKLEFDRAIFVGIKSVIFAGADVVAGDIAVSALAQNNLTFIDGLTTKNFNAEALGDTISSGFRCSASFDVSHRCGLVIIVFEIKISVWQGAEGAGELSGAAVRKPDLYLVHYIAWLNQGQGVILGRFPGGPPAFAK
jgi:hypothetical protein